LWTRTSRDRLWRMMGRWIWMFVLAVECGSAGTLLRHKPAFLTLFQARRKGSPSIRSTNPLGRSPETVASGRQLYNASCTVCHGLDGTAGDRAPALAATRRYVRSSDDAIFDAIKNGIPGTPMPAAGLPDDSVWKIVAYIRNLRARASDENVEGNLEHGAELFHGAARCSECHMIRGNGGLLGPDLSNIGAERTLRQLREALTTVRPNIPFGFQPVRIRAKSGATVDGIIKNENNFSMQVLDRQNRLHLLNREELRDVDYGRKSLMPNDYGERLTPGQLQDVLLFLSRQVQ
jgi:cytochrome c oxidase cbb3-type subunit III